MRRPQTRPSTAPTVQHPAVAGAVAQADADLSNHSLFAARRWLRRAAMVVTTIGLAACAAGPTAPTPPTSEPALRAAPTRLRPHASPTDTTRAPGDTARSSTGGGGWVDPHI